jgi:DNA-binding NarL/FixJ family response regulator
MNGGRYISNSIDMTSEKPALTARQLSVLQLLVKGKSAKQVAEELFISSRTVEFHKYAMMRLLNVKTSAELVQYAINHGLIN